MSLYKHSKTNGKPINKVFSLNKSEIIDIDSFIDTTEINVNCNDSDELNINSISNSDIKNIKHLIKKTKIIKKDKITTKPTKSQRVTMYLKNDDTKPVTAAGALFYKQVGKQMMLLVIENKSKYEDIGGKIDPGDGDIISAVLREIKEETNGQINMENGIERLKTASYVYVPKSKYVIYIIEANASEKKLKKNDFGDREGHDGFARTIGWISLEELTNSATIQYKMNWRMKCKALFVKLTDIEKHFKFKNNMFIQQKG